MVRGRPGPRRDMIEQMACVSQEAQGFKSLPRRTNTFSFLGKKKNCAKRKKIGRLVSGE